MICFVTSKNFVGPKGEIVGLCLSSSFISNWNFCIIF